MRSLPFVTVMPRDGHRQRDDEPNARDAATVRGIAGRDMPDTTTCPRPRVCSARPSESAVIILIGRVAYGIDYFADDIVELAGGDVFETLAAPIEMFVYFDGRLLHFFVGLLASPTKNEVLSARKPGLTIVAVQAHTQHGSRFFLPAVVVLGNSNHLLY
jgi:hypothetical protein